MANRIAPPTATACARTLKNVGQSATPASSWALALINPILRAASGSFMMIINKPSTSGAIENPIAVKSGTLERRILRISVQSAEEKEFMIRSPCSLEDHFVRGQPLALTYQLSVAKNVLQDSVVPPQAGWVDCPH